MSLKYTQFLIWQSPKIRPENNTDMSTVTYFISVVYKKKFKTYSQIEEKNKVMIVWYIIDSKNESNSIKTRFLQCKNIKKERFLKLVDSNLANMTVILLISC